MLRSLATWTTLFVLSTASTLAYSHDAKKDLCERDLSTVVPLTLRSTRELAIKRIAAVEKVVGKAGFDNIEVEAKREQTADRDVPLALQQINSNNVGFVAVAAPVSPDPATVALTSESSSLPLLLESSWRGRRSSTAAFLTLPKPKMMSAGGFAVGPEYKAVYVHLHGGGTPTATGKNAMSIGEKIAPAGIATLAMDLPGHGLSTKNPAGLLSMEDHANWVLQQIRELVHPGVKVIISGHSWGAMIANYMMRHSDEPKYREANIQHFVIMSPGLDMSLGSGKKEDKEAFDDYWKKHYKDFKDQIAPADFEFADNMLANGKDSDVSGYFTTLSDFDYLTPKLTPEKAAKLIPCTVIQGTRDGVTYVGEPRMRAFEESFAVLPPGSEVIMLGDGNTWKGPAATGHNIYDRYIDGTTTLQVYAKLTEISEKAMGGSDVIPNLQDPVAQTLDALFRYYANFLAFREMVAAHVEFVDIGTPQLPELTRRKTELDEYARRIEQAQRENAKMTDERVRSALDNLRKEVGLTENISLERAQEEASGKSLTPERKAELEAYIAKVEALDEQMRTSFVDPASEREAAKLRSEFAGLMKTLGIQNLEDYKAHFEAYQGKKELDAQGKKIRGELSRMHQKMADMQRERQKRYGVERDRRLLELQNPPGVIDIRSARRELTADRSEERRNKLKAYIERYAQVEAQARREAGLEAEAKLEALHKPTGIGHWEEGRRAKEQHDQIMSMTYQPDIPAIARLGKRIAELNEERDRLVKGADGAASMDALAADVEKLRSKRASLVKKWEALWKSGKITSAAVQDDARDYEKSLEGYQSMYDAYEAKNKWLRQLYDEGRLTAANVLAGTPELKAMRHKYLHARGVFIDTRNRVEETKWVEALNNRLVPADGVDPAEGEKAAAEASRIALEVWGEDFGKSRRPSASSLTEQLKAKEELLEERRRHTALVDRERDELRVQYVREMENRRLPVPYRVERVPVFELLNRPLRDLESLLRERPVLLKALISVKSKWESMLSELRRVSQTKDGVGY